MISLSKKKNLDHECQGWCATNLQIFNLIKREESSTKVHSWWGRDQSLPFLIYQMMTIRLQIFFLVLLRISITLLLPIICSSCWMLLGWLIGSDNAFPALHSRIGTKLKRPFKETVKLSSNWWRKCLMKTQWKNLYNLF